MPTPERSQAAPEENVDSLKSRLAYHLHRLGEDATDPELLAVERLALVRDRARRIRAIRAELKATHVRTL